MPRYKLVVEYDGTPFVGWQRQTNGLSIQEVLEAAALSLTGETAIVHGAGRTDAGVHARGQVATFHTDRPIELHGIRRGANSMLPEMIAVREVSEVPATFHPRFSATGKHYRYLLYRGADRSPRWRERAWHHPQTLDLEAMRTAAAALVGEHDFAAFRAIGCAAKTTVRKIHGIDVTEAAEDLLIVDVRGTAFLRNMVRIVVGTLAEVGRGYRPASQVAEILAAKDRALAGMTAPAHGLELMEISYDGSRDGVWRPRV
jgi:tRNA pseudouridine38-40 synthase